MNLIFFLLDIVFTLTATVLCDKNHNCQRSGYMAKDCRGTSAEKKMYVCRKGCDQCESLISGIF